MAKEVETPQVDTSEPVDINNIVDEEQQDGLDDQVESSEEETEEEETEEFDREEVVQALHAWRALNDPARAPNFVATIAKRLGVITDDMTPKQVKQTVKTLQEEIEDALPQGYEDIGRALLPMITKIVEKHTGEVAQSVEQRFAIQAAQEFDRNYNTFITDNTVTEAESNELSELINLYPPNKAISLDRYLGPLLELVRSRKTSQVKQVNKTIKQAINLKRPNVTPKSQSNESTMRPITDAQTPSEAVAFALREMRKKR